MTTTQPFLRSLRSLVSGQVIGIDDDEYDQARRVWNGAIDRSPLAVVRCQSAADVMASVRLATENGTAIAVRAGGHSFAGLGTCDDGVVLDLGLMNTVEVDADARRASVLGGATWGAFDAATTSQGLATTGGLISTTGVAGLTLGGGIGWLMRKHGWTCDNLVAADVVTADGNLVRADSETNPDLLWGLRGGGGNFGVAVRLTFRVHPLQTVLGGALLFPIDQAPMLLDHYARTASEEPDELCSLLEFATAPHIEEVEPQHRGRPVIALAFCWSGDPQLGLRAIAPWRSLAPVVGDFVAEVPYHEMQTFFDADYPRGRCCYTKTHFVDDLDDSVMEALVQSAADRPTATSIIDVHHLEGEASRIPSESAALPHRTARYAVMFMGISEQEAGYESCRSWARESWERLSPHARGSAYVNFQSDVDEVSADAAMGPTLARLAEVKARFDPDNVFHVNQNITPASSSRVLDPSASR